MKYERAYKEEPDEWEPIGEDHLLVIIRQCSSYDSFRRAVIEELHEGGVLETPYAIYRKRQK